ncbi:hypothetical protein EJ110_NYTH36768 [Nymphaea thermarum]|nr:hypothetical protein EJ110_NYTH36768 [Nymphaea thermarum]
MQHSHCSKEVWYRWVLSSLSLRFPDFKIDASKSKAYKILHRRAKGHPRTKSDPMAYGGSSRLLKSTYNTPTHPPTDALIPLSPFDTVTFQTHVRFLYAFKPPNPSNEVIEQGLRRLDGYVMRIQNILILITLMVMERLVPGRDGGEMVLIPHLEMDC